MPSPGQAKEHISTLEALIQDHFTPHELAELLGVSESVVIHAVHRGELQAFTVEHHVVDITRADALDWLRERARA